MTKIVYIREHYSTFFNKKYLLAKKNYIEAFNNLAKELARHSKIELLGYHTFAPLKEQALEALETKYNCQLDETIRRFYTQTNGLQLRWMFKNNPAYHSDKYPPFHRSIAPVGWNYTEESFEKEDGCVLILPLEAVLRNIVSPNVCQEDILLGNKTYSTVDFHTCIRPFDNFSYYCNMSLFLQKGKSPLVLLGDEVGTCFKDSRWTTFGTYLDFILASKAFGRRRKAFFGATEGYKQALIESLPPKIQPYWSLDRLVLTQRFPLADQAPRPTSIKTRKMQEKAYYEGRLSAEELAQMVTAHQDFLNSGGLGGQWKLIAIRGQALGIYKGNEYERGTQAILDMKKMDHSLELQELFLPYSSWCGVYAKAQDFSDVDLTGSLFTDANLEYTIFAEANLENVDFSRSNLKRASFVNSNLRGADFENCNLMGADFRGAVLDGSQFRGAVLKGVIW